MSLTFIDWFAGCGGFRRGMELAGHKCVGFCEVDKYAVMSYTSMHLVTEEQRAYLATLPLKQRQKEILKEEYRNGEWYADDIRRVYAGDIPKADCWCFGAPCQDFSVAGRRAGLDGDRSSLVREVFRILREMPEEDRPEWLVYENVKGMLSSNRGFDFLAILLELDEGGYDIEWQIFNSKDYGVPQNRERVYTIGHLRTKGPTKILPIEGADGSHCLQVECLNPKGGRKDNPDVQPSIKDRVYSTEASAPTVATSEFFNPTFAVKVEQIGMDGTSRRNNPNQNRVYDPKGISSALNCMEGGGREPHIPIQIEAHYPSGNQKNAIFGIGGGGENTNRNGLQATVFCSSTNVIGNTNPSGKGMNGNCYSSDGVNPTLTTNKGEGNKVVIPVLTPDRANKRQNGRRFKEDGDETFTLTSQDRHGVAVGVDDLYANREPRFYDEEIPTMRSDRTGLKVAVEVKPEVIGGIGEKN